ncbi:hypothetical protein ACWGBX_31340, partial [Streptomyces sp. NPDC055037]
MNRRHSAAAAITVVCALAVLASPALMNGAYAAPAPPPAPASTTSAVAPPPVELPPGADASAGPGSTTGSGGKSLEDIRKEIEALYQKAASATDAYNLAEEETKKQSAEVIELAEDIVTGQLRIDALKK